MTETNSTSPSSNETTQALTVVEKTNEQLEKFQEAERRLAEALAKVETGDADEIDNAVAETAELIVSKLSEGAETESDDSAEQTGSVTQNKKEEEEVVAKTEPDKSSLFVANGDMNMNDIKRAAGIETTDSSSFIMEGWNPADKPENNNPENEHTAEHSIVNNSSEDEETPIPRVEKSRGDWEDITRRELTAINDRLALKDIDATPDEEVKKLEERRKTLEETLDYLNYRPVSAENLTEGSDDSWNGLPNEENFNDRRYEDMTIEELNDIRKQALENQDATTVTNVVNEIANRNNRETVSSNEEPKDKDETEEVSEKHEPGLGVADYTGGEQPIAGDFNEQIPGQLGWVETNGEEPVPPSPEKDETEEPAGKPEPGLGVADYTGGEQPIAGDFNEQIPGQLGWVETNGEEPVPPSPEKDEVEENQEPTPEKTENDFKFSAGKSNNLTQEIMRLAQELGAKDQEASKLKNSKSIIKAIKGRVKYNALFKKNTEVRLAKEILDMMRQEAGERPLTYDDLRKVYLAKGVTMPDDNERSFLHVISQEVAGMGTEIDIPDETANKIRGLAADYATAINSSGISEEQKNQIFSSYQEQISELAQGAVGVEAKDIKIYADTAAELLTQISATIKHETAMEDVQKMISEMEINLTEAKIDANNNMDVSYLEKIDELGQKHNTANAIGKASFVIGTWVATGVAAGIAVRGLRQGGTMAASAGVGAVLAGPVGVLVGIGAVSVGSAVWGRYMARRRENEQINMFAANVVEDNEFKLSRKGRKAIANYLDTEGNLRADLSDEDRAEAEAIMTNERVSTKAEIAKPKQESMSEVISDLMRYMEPAEGLPEDWDKNDISNYAIRDDLSIEEKQTLAMTFARITEKIDIENKYNESARAVADEESGRSGFRKLMSTSDNVEGRALNLFSSKSQESFFSEKVNMMIALQKARELVDSEGFKDIEVQLQTGEPDEATVKNVKISELMNIIASTEQAESTKNINEWQDRIVKSINRAGRVGGGVSFGVSMAVGLASAFTMAAIAEKQTSGEAETLLDLFSKNKNVSPGQPQPVPVTRNGNQLDIAMKDGTTVSIPTGPDGQVAQADIDALKNIGVELTQKSFNTNVDSSTTEILKDIGGYAAEVRYLDNFTPTIFEGTEQGLRYVFADNGDIVISQGLGVAKSATHGNFDISEAVTAGALRMRFEEIADGARTVLLSEPMQMIDGRPSLVIEAGSDLAKLFKVDPATGKISQLLSRVGSTIVDEGGKLLSVATNSGPSGSTITETITGFTHEATSVIAENAAKFFAFISGLHTPGTKSGYDGNMKKPAGSKPKPEDDKQPTPTEGYGQNGEPTPTETPTEGYGQNGEPIPTETPTEGYGQNGEPTPTGSNSPTVPSTNPVAVDLMEDDKTGNTPAPREEFIEDFEAIQQEAQRKRQAKIEETFGVTSSGEATPPETPTEGDGQEKQNQENGRNLSVFSDEYILNNYKYQSKNNPDQAPQYREELQKRGIDIPKDFEIAEDIDYDSIITDLSRKRKETFRDVSQGSNMSREDFEKKISFIDTQIEEQRKRQANRLISSYRDAITEDKRNGNGPSARTLAIRAEMDRLGI